MKKYSTKIAAQLMVRPQVAHGLSRHQCPELARTKVVSVSTERAHISALKVFADRLLDSYGKHLKHANRDDACLYLHERASEVRQKTLDLDRQSINMHLGFDKKLGYHLSTCTTIAHDRAYSKSQLDFLISRAKPDLTLSIGLAQNAGLRSMELMTIAPADELPTSVRDWHPGRFDGRLNDSSYVVHGKGGLRREIRLSSGLAERMNVRRRLAPVQLSHRGAHLTSFFDVVGGHSFSDRFSDLSLKELGFSHGAHGLRHTFAQNRLLELMCLGHDAEEALQILAQEMGHFSVTNTLIYLQMRFPCAETEKS